MRIDCRHGYFILTEEKSGEFSKMNTFLGLKVASRGDHFTFEYLVNAPRLSIKDRLYMGLPAKKTFAGEPWEVFRENGFVFDFTKNTLVEIGSVQLNVQVERGLRWYLSQGLILPGSLTADGKRVKDYSAWLLWGTYSFRYTELFFE